MGIQINGNTNNINAGIGSLSIEDLREIDIVGVATAANFKTGVSNLHSVGLSLSGGQIDVGSNIKIGTAGVVTATTFSGSGASLTNLNASNIASGTVPTARLGSGTASSSTFLAGDSTFKTITGTTISNNTNNYVVTATGTANTLNGEANLTWDGAQLYVNCGNYSEPILINSVQSSVRATIRQTNNANANSGLAIQKRHSSLHQANHWYGDISFEGWDGSGYHKAGLIECVAEGTPANDNMPGGLRFSTNAGGTNPTERLRIASDGNVHINTVDNGNASAKLNVENSSSAGADVLKIMNKPSGANGKAKLVFHTETSTGQGCQPYIQSLSGADAGPNATNNHNAGGLEFHTRSGGSGTDNNAMRIRDDGTVEKYGSVGQILLKPSGAELEFTRGSASNILCSHSAGYLNIFTGGYTNVPAMRIFASAGAGSGAKVGINTDQSGGDWQMAIHANPSVPSMMISHGIRMLSNTNNDKRINFSGVNYTSGSFQANNNWNRIAIGRYMGGSFTLVIGDASSKNTIFGNFQMTAPNYGVGHLNKIASNGAWNTGSSDIEIQNDGMTYDYAIMARHNSYYNSSATASYGLITNLGL